MHIPGIDPGPATASYLLRRKRILTVIAAPWFAALLAFPQLIDSVVPSRAQVGVNGVSIVLLAAIVFGITQGLSELDKVDAASGR